MAKEIEKKYLIIEPIPWELTEQKLIKQGYISIEKDKQVRVRIIGNQSYICVKYFGLISRDEFEYEIPLMDGLEMFSKCKLRVEKIRNTLQPMDHSYTIDIDTYPNKLMVAEVEFKSVEDYHSFEPLYWFGEDITGNDAYSNIALAKLKLKF